MTGTTPATNGATMASNTTKSSTSATSGGNKAQSKTSTGSKGLDGARKQAGSPVDGAQRWDIEFLSALFSAWTQGTNPITQRSTTPNTTNGTTNQSSKLPVVPARSQAGTVKEPHSADKDAHDRLLFLLTHFTGLQANITVKNGEQYSGIFSGASTEPTEPSYLLKMVKRVYLPAEQQTNGANEPSEEYIGTGEDHIVLFNVQDVADLSVSGVDIGKAEAKAANGLSSGFRTDTDISGNVVPRERDLQRWEPSVESSIDMSLEETGNTSWDQFAVNERLYGVTSSYNEEEYTTTIDRSTADYKRREAAAAKIAREIENSSALNAHVKEERGDTYGNGSGLDEEEKYSGVARNFPPLSSGQPNKYTPPARRPPTGQPTVSGAPFDPAIISSQLRDPGAPSTKPVQTQSQVSAEAQPSSIAAKQDAQAVPTVSVPSEFSTADASATSNATTYGPTDLPTKASGTDAAVVKPSSPSAAPLVQEKKTKVLNATANVEKDLLNSFREFSNSEKLKVQERQRSHAKHEKTVRMNDLKKFAQNFKLKTEVPQDLIPILAKDKTKQDEIIEKAKRQKQEAEVAAGTASSHATPSPVEQKVQQPPPSGVVETNIVSPSSQIDRQSRSRAQPPQAPRLMHAQNITLPSPRHAMPLSARLTINQQQHKAGLSGHIPPPVPMELHIPPHNPAGPVSTDLLSPTSSASTRFNVKATEFRPNAAAAGFTPSGPSAGISPKLDTSRPANTTSSIFKGKKPAPVVKSINDAFNSIKYLRKLAEKDNKTKDYEMNGGITPAYRTPPTWEVSAENIDKTYSDMFPKTVVSLPLASPARTPSSGLLPHQHQLPLHLQQGVPSQVLTPQQTPRHYNTQPYHGPNGPHHFDDHHMRFSSSSSSVQPSPRYAHPVMLYNGQVPANMQQFGQAMPHFGMSPGPHVGQMAAGVPFIPPPSMGGQMMVQQASNGPYMNGPAPSQMQMQMGYSPSPRHVQPHFNNMQPQQGPNGYPSPRTAPMSHQGSQQGHPPPQVMYMTVGLNGQSMGQTMPPLPGQMMFGQVPGPMTPLRPYGQQHHQPQFAPSPHQQHPYPVQQQHRGGSNMHYNQHMTPRQHQATPQQHQAPPAHMGNGPHGGDDGK
ncbi:hypothetical protein LTR04_006161 [Oleoguttula sp. CCFEE 6159]|nr:hypothetical protein LTR04_006161 [Oleoguttula sp. CCFEE 6159]